MYFGVMRYQVRRFSVPELETRHVVSNDTTELEFRHANFSCFHPGIRCKLYAQLVPGIHAGKVTLVAAGLEIDRGITGENERHNMLCVFLRQLVLKGIPGVIPA